MNAQNVHMNRYSDEFTKLFMEDDDDPVDLSTPRINCVSRQWLVQLYEFLEDNPHIIVHSYRHAGIYDALGSLDENDLPKTSLILQIMKQTRIKLLKVFHPQTLSIRCILRLARRGIKV